MFDLGLTLLISTVVQKSITTHIFVCVLKICQGIRRYGFGSKFLCKAMMTIVHLEIVLNRLDAEASLYSSLAYISNPNNSMVRAFINH